MEKLTAPNHVISKSHPKVRPIRIKKQRRPSRNQHMVKAGARVLLVVTDWKSQRSSKIHHAGCVTRIVYISILKKCQSLKRHLNIQKLNVAAVIRARPGSTSLAVISCVDFSQDGAIRLMKTKDAMTAMQTRSV